LIFKFTLYLSLSADSHVTSFTATTIVVNVAKKIIKASLDDDVLSNKNNKLEKV